MSAAFPVIKSLAPTIGKTLSLSALSGLASEGVCQLVKKISRNKVDKLIAYEKYLTEKQKQDILNALPTGSGVYIKPTQKQLGSGFGTILASIGIPLAIEAIKKITGKGAPRMGAPINEGLIPYQLQPPLFFGTWKNPIGMGKKKKTWKGKGFLLGKNSPFNSIPILGAIL